MAFMFIFYAIIGGDIIFPLILRLSRNETKGNQILFSLRLSGINLEKWPEVLLSQRLRGFNSCKSETKVNSIPLSLRLSGIKFRLV